jgi:hypothetical protein
LIAYTYGAQENSTPTSKSNNIFEQISKLNPSLTTIDYVKRFFYQILGIYFPSIFLILYLLLFWNSQPYLFSLNNIGTPDLTSPIQNLETFFHYIGSHDSWILLILSIVVVVALGEAINSITSKIDKNQSNQTKSFQ